MRRPENTSRFRQIKAGMCLLLCLLTLTAQAAQLYRYKDDNGNMVLDSTVPPKYVGKGYDILSESGRLIERVPPALTPEQIAERDAERERQRQRELAQEKQAEKDRELKQLYSHPDDAVRVLKRRLSDIQSVIQVKQGKISSAQEQIVEQETKAANLQRKGIAIPDNILSRINSLKNDIANAETDISELKNERIKVLDEFDQIIRRLETIMDTPSVNYQPLLDSLGLEPEAANESGASEHTAQPE